MLCTAEELIAGGVNVVYLAELGHPSEPWSCMVVRGSESEKEKNKRKTKKNMSAESIDSKHSLPLGQ